jgi:tetratricopeptide (TPR) repeat protein
MANFKRIGSEPVLFERYADAMDIRYVALHYDVGYLPERLIKSLIDSPRWQPVYFDEISVVFVRTIPENAQVIETFGIDFATFENKKEEFDAALPADIGESHFSGAHGTLSRLTDRIPRQNFPFAEVTRADFYKSLGYYDNARLLYERALEVYADSTIAHSGLGTVYWKLKLYSFALAEFEAVLKLNPRSAANLMNLGNMNLVTGRTDEAVECFRKAKKLDPDKYLAPLQLGRIYARQGRYEMAARELMQALKLNPDLQDARELLREVEQRRRTGGQ